MCLTRCFSGLSSGWIGNMSFHCIKKGRPDMNLKRFWRVPTLIVGAIFVDGSAAHGQVRTQFPSQMFECQPENNGHFTNLGTLFFSVFDDPYVGTIRYMEFNGLRPVEYKAMLSFYDFEQGEPSWWAQFVATDLIHEEESREYQIVVGVTEMNHLISTVSFVQVAGELVIYASDGPSVFLCNRIEDRATIENNFSYFMNYIVTQQG